MANAVDLRMNPIFVAENLYCSEEMAIGREFNCSYYTTVTIFKGDPDKIQLETLRNALVAALEKLDSAGK